MTEVQTTAILPLRIQHPRRHTGLVKLVFASCVLAAGTTAQAQSAPSPMITTPTGADTTPDLGRDVASRPYADGAFQFVEMLGGDVGVIAQGDTAAATLRGVLAGYRTTPLEIYVAAGGSRGTAPAALVADARRREATQGPSSPLPPLSTIPLSSTAVFGEQGLGTVGGTTCFGSGDSFATFKNWLHLFQSPVGPIENIGAHGQQGIGTESGPANLTLGSTSEGVALVCFPDGANTNVRLTVQEYKGNGLWADLWHTSTVFEGAGYGYWFTGALVHKVRLLIRQDQQIIPGTIGPFHWFGSY